MPSTIEKIMINRRIQRSPGHPWLLSSDKPICAMANAGYGHPTSNPTSQPRHPRSCRGGIIDDARARGNLPRDLRNESLAPHRSRQRADRQQAESTARDRPRHRHGIGPRRGQGKVTGKMAVPPRKSALAGSKLWRTTCQWL